MGKLISIMAMKQTFFIADLHLDENRPDITECFIGFLLNTAPQADALYILGDLFEAWIGDDENTTLQNKVQQALARLSQQIPVYFIHGNRDFLLGKQYTQAAGVTLLPDPFLIDLYGKPILIMHGDTLCTDDIKYQAFRKKVQSPWLQKLFLLLPLSVRKKIAQKMRKQSKKHTNTLQLDIMNVNQTAVQQIMESYQVDLLIHGHTHRPAVHNNQNSCRVVLPDWDSKGGLLVYQEDHDFFLTKLNESGYTTPGFNKELNSDD